MLITSVNNNHIKELSKLKDKKYRDLTDTYLVETKHLVEEAYKENLLEELILLENTDYKLDVNTIYVSSDILKKLSNTNSPSSIIGLVRKKKEKPELGSKILILDNIQDPGNLGTVIRSSVAFNFDTIVLSKDTVDLYNPKVVRATEGMIYKINIIVKDLEEFIKSIKDKYTIYGTNVINGVNIDSITIRDNIAVVIGNEGQGISKNISDLCDKNLYIAMSNKCESLNAAVASSIIMYELNKDRK